MATKRTYGEACACAHALDLIGERWALLVVRELLLGPKRFTDLREGLVHASPNVIAQRLREMEESGVVRRRRLGPPFSTWVYELTDWGRELEPVIIALGRWGVRSPYRSPDAAISVDSIALAFRAIFDPDAAGDLDATFELRLGDDRFAITVDDGTLEIVRGDAADPDAVVSTDGDTLRRVLSGIDSVRAVMKGGAFAVTGETRSVERLFAALRAPERIPAPSA